MNTRFSRSSLNFLITASVNVSHPMFRCEPVWWARTVRTEFIGNTPWLTQRSKFPEEGIGYRETDPVVLPRIRIGVLSQDNDFNLLERACVKYMEYLRPGRKYVRLLIFVFDKCHQLLEIRLVEFLLQTFSPTFIYSNIHGVFLILPPKVRRKA